VCRPHPGISKASITQCHGVNISPSPTR
jgi:hypothetical protein